jgi:hypothetical protein
VDCEANLWVLLLLEECAQPGMGHMKESIILDVVGRGGGCVKAPLRDSHEDAGKGGFVVGIFGEGVDEGVEVGSFFCWWGIFQMQVSRSHVLKNQIVLGQVGLES